MDIFHSLHERGRTIIIVTHEPDIARHSERIIHMRDGMVYSDEPNRNPAEALSVQLSARAEQLLPVGAQENT